MEQAEASAEVQGTEKTEFKGTVQDNIVKIPIHLRPKSDEDLIQWKEKLAKGKEDGTYTYTFASQTSIPNGSGDEKKRIAGNILNNTKNGLRGNPKIENGKTAFAEDIENALTETQYLAGKTINFKIYKKQEELLYINVKAQGEEKHDKDFLKVDGGYFQIGDGKCPRCEEEITLKHIEDLFGVHPSSKDFRKQVVEFLNLYVKQRQNTDKPIHINTCLRKAHFFAQVGAETLGINTDWIVETDVIPYKPANIRNIGIFGDRSGKLERRGQIEEFCRERPQIKLLSFLYANENRFGNGNGNEASQEGYKYRGRGLKQLTGKSNYKNASETLKEIFPAEYVDLVENPNKVKEAKYAVLSALAYWEKHEIWKVADDIKTSNDENIKKIRRTVNGGVAGWKDAKKYFENGIDVFKVNNCSPVDKVSNGKWNDPIAYSQRTYYNSESVHAEKNGAFGKVRNGGTKNHQGLDIFATLGTPLVACLDGTVVAIFESSSYGTILILEVDGDALRSSKRNYTIAFTGEIENGEGFNTSASKYYLRYCHLSLVEIKSGEVKGGDTICYSGDSGNAKGAPNPHLHFEIGSNMYPGSKEGTKNRTNPAFYVDLKPIDEPMQTKVKNDRNSKK